MIGGKMCNLSTSKLMGLQRRCWSTPARTAGRKKQKMLPQLPTSNELSELLPFLKERDRQEIDKLLRPLILTENDLQRYVKDRFGVSIPDTQVCPNHSTPWRAFADAYFARSVVGVWKASRGFGGKSYLLSVLGLTEAATLGVDVNVLGGSGEQSQRVLAHMLNFWNYEHAPRNLLASEPAKRETRLTNGSPIPAVVGSQARVRGAPPGRVRCDEGDLFG